MAGTLAAICFQKWPGIGRVGVGSILTKKMEQGFGNREILFFQVWLQRSGMALMLWLAGMTPVTWLAAWGTCLVLGLEFAWLLAEFTDWGGFWGLPVFAATLFPQMVFYIPVFLLLLSWAITKERRIRAGGCLILLLFLGMGAALEVWLNPVFVSFLVSYCPF